MRLSECRTASPDKPIDWRINVIISSRDLGRVLKPLIYMQVELEDGRTESIEVPVSKFHLFRQNVALILKEMESYK